MKISELKPLEKNPFKVKGDAKLEKIGKSIKDISTKINKRNNLTKWQTNKT